MNLIVEHLKVKRWAYGCKSRNLSLQKCTVTLGVTHLSFINFNFFYYAQQKNKFRKTSNGENYRQ